MFISSVGEMSFFLLQPLYVGFTSDEGGNTIKLRWFRHKSNLNHAWDRQIILTAAAESLPGRNREKFHSRKKNVFHSSTIHCMLQRAINVACKWGYKEVEPGITLAEDYFESGFPIVTRRIAQGGQRLAMTLNRVFSDHKQAISAPI
ncbi:endonuclease 1-like isoform X1 [Aristolochia californica]|uniref:endonuclease 1-like isoform X1 n=1 Tax=Aristolochia californica TaxID=171875 RepID=UPI0035E28659